MKNNLMSRIAGRFVAAQERRAQRYITSALNRFDDETLRNLGYEPTKIRNSPDSLPII